MPSLFAPIAIGALYPGIERGLTADILAAHALGGRAYPVCASHLVAGHGKVTDVLEVPSDTVASQLEHLFATTRPTGAKVSVIGSAASVEAALRVLGLHLQGPLLLDVTLSGPSGEDLADDAVREALIKRFPLADVVSVRKHDAELVVGMEIGTLDDAQVAVQRLHRLGARAAVLRLGRLDASENATFATDLVYDGSDFALFEAPWIDSERTTHGASSALHMALLDGLVRERPLLETMQRAKAFVTDALRAGASAPQGDGVAYFAASSVASLST